MSDRTMSWSEHEAKRREEVRLIVGNVDTQADKYRGILPSDVEWEDFRNAFLVAVQMNPRLLEADRASLFLELQRAAGMGLKPDGREGALVIFGDDQEDDEGNPVPSQAKGKKKVVFMPMVWGLCKLARNVGTIRTIRAQLVYKGESFVISDVNGQRSYSHTRDFGAQDIDDSPANIIAAYSVIEYRNGDWDIEPMSRARIERVKSISRAKRGSSPWNVWYDEQAKKTVIRSHLKRVDRSRELQRLDEVLSHDTTLDVEGIDDREKREAAQQQITQEFTAPPIDLHKARQEAIRRAEADARASSPPQHAETPGGGGMAGAAAPSEPEKPANGRRTRGPNKPKPAPSHGSPELDRDAAKLSAMGQDPGPTLNELEISPVDESGELAGPAFDSPWEFAHWFAKTMMSSDDPEALRRNNEDAIEQCRVELPAYNSIMQLLAAQSGDDPHAASEHGDAAPAGGETIPPPTPPAPPSRKPIVALTPSGQYHDGKFREQAKAEVANLKDEDDIQDWLRTNDAVLRVKAVGLVVPNWLRDRRRELGIPEPPDAPKGI